MLSISPTDLNSAIVVIKTEPHAVAQRLVTKTGIRTDIRLVVAGYQLLAAYLAATVSTLIPVAWAPAQPLTLQSLILAGGVSGGVLWLVILAKGRPRVAIRSIVLGSAVPSIILDSGMALHWPWFAAMAALGGVVGLIGLIRLLPPLVDAALSVRETWYEDPITT